MQPLWRLVMSWNKYNQKCLLRHCPALKHWPICFNALHHYWFSQGCTLQGLATKTGKKNKPKTREWLNFSRPVLFSHVFFQSSTCEDWRKGEKTRHWMTKFYFWTGEILRYQQGKSTPARQTWEEAHVEVWLCSWPCVEEDRAVGQHSLSRVGFHNTCSMRRSTKQGGHVHPLTHTLGCTNNLLGWIKAGFAEFF